MGKVNIRLNSGKEIIFTCEKFEVCRNLIDGSIESIKWENIRRGEIPLYIRLKSVECVTEIDPEESGGE